MSPHRANFRAETRADDQTSIPSATVRKLSTDGACEEAVVGIRENEDTVPSLTKKLKWVTGSCSMVFEAKRLAVSIVDP
jgi:hypothetical protein